MAAVAVRLAVVVAVAFLMPGCGDGDSGSTATECGSDALDVPAPDIAADGIDSAMDLVYVRGCGTEADGAVGVGADPVLVEADGEVTVAVADGYGVRFSIAPEDSEAAVLEEADSEFTIAVPDDGCHLLTVELNGDAVEARYAARLTASRDDCDPAV